MIIIIIKTMILKTEKKVKKKLKVINNKDGQQLILDFLKKT